jgi:D-alanyl-D-alanine carboxypeptidase
MRKNTRLYLTVMIIIALISSFMTVYAHGASVAKRTGISGISAKSCALYIPETDEFIFEKSADVRMPMASTTKIMTALVAVENADLDEKVVIDERSVNIEGSSAYLRVGDVLTMEELVYALLLQSANDAAVAIANHISGSVENFANLMNERALRLSLTDTHFTNPHGLDDKDHYTTARELSVIAKEALSHDVLKSAFQTYKRTFRYGERVRTYVNHNKLLSLYDDAIGVKTGFTKKSGRCLVGAAERDGLTLIAVTLNAPSDWHDHMALFDYGYDNYEKLTLAYEGEYEYDRFVFNSVGSKIKISNRDELTIIRKKKDSDIKASVKLPDFIFAPISQNDVLGKVVFTDKGEYLGEINLYAEKEFSLEDNLGFFDKLLSIFKR